DGPVRTIELVSETPDTWIFHATTTDEIANLQSLEANDKSTTTVKDSKTWAIFNNEAEGAKIKVSGYIDDGDNSVDYVVTFYEADPEVGKYKLKGYYIYDDGSTLGKLHAIIVNLTIVPANEI
ncbi:MAG: hypothetical protein LBV22_03515, partial [Mycoplasmataceae bacterium]|nr:hypothetical protein [Mycoplasmataceae bacterium]